MKKAIAILLCILMLIPMFCACTNNKKGDGEAVSPLPEGSHVSEDKKFEGETFTILCREDNAYGEYVYEIVADEGETEIVNQAIYERNRNVMDVFGLSDIVARDIPGDWGNKDDFINSFKNSIDAGLGDFDLIMSQQAYMAVGELAQYFYNYYDVPYVSETLNCNDETHDHTYYYPDLVEEMTINGQLKYMVGDYCLTYWDHTFVMYFNKELAENYQLENIYDLVREGKWTIDKCLEMSRNKWTDLNNDNWPGIEDAFGYITDIPNTTDAMIAQFQVPPTHRDENGDIVVEYDVGKVTNILEKMLDFQKTDDYYKVHTTSDMVDAENPLDKMFIEGRALFYPAILQNAQIFRSMETDFGIVPYPKWNETQDKYYTSANVGFSVACVPADVPNLEKTGAVFDTLSAISKEKVIPAYYEEALAYKYTRDEDSAEMLDIIRDGFDLNFGVFYAQSIGCASIFSHLMANDNPNFASYYAANYKGYERKLSQLLEYYE
ncbi:MAG: hypothetical protein IKU52_01085 [Clostridia bacterium]|nr:hypothetical protein [Clostridia bacterium]